MIEVILNRWTEFFYKQFPLSKKVGGVDEDWMSKYIDIKFLSYWKKKAATLVIEQTAHM